MKNDDRIDRFERFKRLRYQRINRQTDRPTIPTDMTSYRSARTHLKTDVFCEFSNHVLDSSSGKGMRQEMENWG